MEETSHSNKILKKSKKSCEKVLTFITICYIINFVEGNKNFKQEKRQLGPVAQLVRVPACHAGGRGFEPLLGRF